MILARKARVFLSASVSLRRTFASNGIRIADEVAEAIARNRPVVALESTIISHGMPYPRNLECALRIEQIVRAEGAVPATIAILDGVPHVGLSRDQIFQLAKNQHSVRKASTKDLAFCMAEMATASTTVASTMAFARRAGIRVFATGGIGGVHRGVEETMDISADLFELAQTPVTVVCAGIKSILDIPKSLEVLETYAVPVVGYRTTTFPAFFTNSSGVPLSQSAESPLQVARMMHAHYDMLQLRSGMVVAAPNPSPMDSNLIEAAISNALQIAQARNITGAKITPFLLAEVEKITRGASLQSNIALVENNAIIAAKIAQAYCSLQPAASGSEGSSARGGGGGDVSHAQLHSPPQPSSPPSHSTPSSSSASLAPDVLVVGGAVVDLIGTLHPSVENGLLSEHPMAYAPSSYPGQVARGVGGVGHNVATHLARAGVNTMMVTALGEDAAGRDIQQRAKDLSLNLSASLVSPHQSTATYMAIHNHHKDLYVGLADMNIFKLLTPHYLSHNASFLAGLETARMLILDGNLSPETFHYLCYAAEQRHIPVFFEPTSNYKCVLPLEAQSLEKLALIKPNLSELITLVEAVLQLPSSSYLTHANRLDGAEHFQSLIAKYRNHTREGEKRHRLASHPVEEETGLSVGDVQYLAMYLLTCMASPTSRGASFSVLKQVAGKHVLVSLGKHGVCWAHNNETLFKEQLSIGQDPQNFMQLVDEGQRFCAGVCYLPLDLPTEGERSEESRILSPEEMKTSTNGAGDAFCAGVVAHVLQQGSSIASGSKSTWPNMQSFWNGLRFARSHLTKA